MTVKEFWGRSVRSLFVATLLAGVAFALSPPEAARAAEYPCTEYGLDLALAAGGGPHTFDCHHPTTITLTHPKYVAGTVILDGEGLLTISGGDAVRVFYVTKSGRFELRNTTVTRGAADEGAGILVFTYGRLTLVNSKVRENEASETGGGIYVYPRADAVLEESVVEDNTAGDSGGGIYARATAGAVLEHSVVEDNEAGISGGGITALGDLRLIDSVVDNNRSGNSGGGISVGQDSQTTIVEGSRITHNEATFHGGGIKNSGYLEIEDSEVSDNAVGLDGGGINNGATAILNNVTIANNKARSGGGIRATDTMTISGCTVSGNQALGGSGGGITASIGTVVIDECDILDNTSTHGGGGVVVYDTATVEINHSRILGNSADQGGGIENRGDLTLRDTTIGAQGQANRAEELGGGIFNDDGDLLIYSSTIDNNRAELCGGGVYNAQGAYLEMHEGSRVVLNVANRGGGFVNSDGDIVIRGSTINENSAYEFGGAIFNYGGTVLVGASDIEGNRADRQGGGIFIMPGGDVTVHDNSRVLYNEAQLTGGGVLNTGSFTITQSCIVGNTDIAAENVPPAGTFLAEQVWWGAKDGPSGEGPGSGDSVSGGVDYDPWLTEPLPGCPSLP